MSSEYPFTDVPTIDETVANPLKELLGDSFYELVNDFLTDFPVKFKSLLSAQDGNDVDTIFKIAHTLKSSSGSFGFIRLYKQLEHLELQARKDNLIKPDEQLTFIEQEFNKVVSETDRH